MKMAVRPGTVAGFRGRLSQARHASGSQHGWLSGACGSLQHPLRWGRQQAFAKALAPEEFTAVLVALREGVPAGLRAWAGAGVRG
jgi:hypothetical protein